MKLLHATFFMCLLSIGAWAQTFQIGHASITVNDPSRGGRSIGMEVYYPAATAGNNVPVSPGEFPLLVFGHGFTMDYDAYQNFWEKLVPEGYIIALATTETGFSPSHSDFGADLSYMTNWFLQQDTTASSDFFNHISGKTAVMGHSMGGGASFLAADQNPNITALATFAPAETTPSAITAAGNLTIPALIFSGGNDNVTPPADHQIPMYNALQSDCKTRVTIEDGAHCRFANSNTLCQLGEGAVCIGCSFVDRAVQHQLQFQVLLPFLDFYLKGNCNAWGNWQSVLANPSGYTLVNSCSYTLPTVDIQVSGSSALCTLDTTTLQAVGNGNLLWSTGETATNIEITTPGQYRLTLTDGLGCETIDSVTINANNVVQPVLVSSLGNAFCAGDTATLSVNSAYTSYSWSTGDTTAMIRASANGDFYLTVTDANGCTATSDTLVLTINQPAVNPILSYTNDSLFATGGTIVQWLFNGSALSGYTGSFLYPVTAGDYEILVADSNGCQSKSAVFTVQEDTTVGVVNIPGAEWTVYPNPVRDMLVVEFSGMVATVKVFNLMGQELFPPKQLQLGKLVLDMSGQPENLYFIQLQSQGKSYIRKVFVQH